MRFRALSVTALLCTTGAFAQAPEGSDRLSPFAVAESIGVLKRLNESVRDSSKVADVWYRRGMVAWTLYARSLHPPPIRGLASWQSLTGLADTSLRRALELEPANEKYFVAVARFLLQSGVTFRTYGAYGVFSDEMERVRKSGDAVTVARTALGAARLYWLRYDRLMCRSVLFNDGLPPPTLEAQGATFSAKPGSPLHDITLDYAGEIDYLKTELLLREGYSTLPADAQLFRQYAMLLADHKRWRELAAVSRDHIINAPRDGWGYMAMGLAQHRIGNHRGSAIAFDSAFVVLGDSVRKFLDRFERTLDSLSLMAFVENGPDARKKVEAVYWRNMDPIWSVAGTEPRAEYLARVTFAQLRWGSDELTLDGVTSDFGNIYLRTGRWEPGSEEGGAFWRPPGFPPDRRKDICVPQVRPWYFAGDTTVPHGPRANWGNLARMRIDSIPTQVARFRAAHDSTDVLVAALPPVALVQRTANVKGPARTDFWLLAGGTDDFARDSLLPATPGVARFVHRVPAGLFVYRTETSADGAVIVARATAGLIAGDDPRTGFSTRGFGVSDVLVASTISAPGTPRRWSDITFTPLVGPALRKSQVSILWENYDLAQISGSAQYTVAVTLRSETEMSRSGRIAAAIIGGIANAIGVNRGKDQVEFTFDRTSAPSAVIPDYLTLSLGDTPAGSYLLTLKITDKATGRWTGRSQRLVIVEPPPRR